MEANELRSRTGVFNEPEGTYELTQVKAALAIPRCHDGILKHRRGSYLE